MKKRLKDCAKTNRYLKKLPDIYLVACWYKFGVRHFPFSGKFKKYANGTLVPLVWDFDDHNGTYPEWILRPIFDTTTGFSLTWTFSENIAERIASKFNFYDEMKGKYTAEE